MVSVFGLVSGNMNTFSKPIVNIFYLDSDPVTCAHYHVDWHVISQVVEYAQILSTVHRLVDGIEYKGYTAAYVKIKRWRLADLDKEQVLYKAIGVQHPHVIWACQSRENYMWLYQLFATLCKEYTARYKKVHKSEQIGLIDLLSSAPNTIPDIPFTLPNSIIPEQYIVPGDPMKSYHAFYNAEKRQIFNWKYREIPYFIQQTISEDDN